MKQNNDNDKQKTRQKSTCKMTKINVSDVTCLVTPFMTPSGFLLFVGIDFARVEKSLMFEEISTLIKNLQ